MVDIMTGNHTFSRADLEQLEVQIQTCLGSRIHDLRLTLRGTIIVLQGCVQTYFAKLLAEQTLRKAVGEHLLVNEIVVM
ncbi:MAG: hypothetical protein ACFCD0_06585 [Gemmataceae bacterium]